MESKRSAYFSQSLCESKPSATFGISEIGGLSGVVIGFLHTGTDDEDR
jgi:hypothetical protein